MNLKNKLFSAFNVSFPTLVIGVFCVITPLLYTTNTLDPALTIRTLSLSFCALILIISFLINKKPLLKPNYAFYVLLLLTLFFILSSIFSSGIKSETLQSIVKLAGISILTYFITTEIRQRNNKLFLVKAIVLFSLTAIIVVLFDYFYILQYNKEELTNKNIFTQLSLVGSFASNRNLLASIFLLTFPFNIYSVYYNSKIWKWLAVTALLLSVFIILITTSRAGLFVLCLYLITIFYLILMSKIGLWKKAVIVFGFFVFCVAGFYVLSTNNTIKRFDTIKTIDKIKNTNRWMFYKNTVDIIKQYPVLGVGPEIGNLKMKNMIN